MQKHCRVQVPQTDAIGRLGRSYNLIDAMHERVEDAARDNVSAQICIDSPHLETRPIP
jgi:hypothetical protein